MQHSVTCRYTMPSLGAVPVKFRLSQTMSTLFVNNLTNIDFSYLHPTRGVVGETWLLDVELDGELDAQGMVFDFGDVKPLIKRFADNTVDHSLAVPDKRVEWLSAAGERPHFRFQLESGGVIEHQSPDEALCVLPLTDIAPEPVARWMEAELLPQLPENVKALRITLTPEPIPGAFYHYSHGLKHHGGNCQRIAHGHRSQIQLFKDGVRQTALEQQWAERWRDIYIGTQEDLLETVELAGEPHYRFAYNSAQGEFALTVPKRCCDLMRTDSTVELIAEFIFQQLGDAELTVRAFEGVGKGAVAGPRG